MILREYYGKTGGSFRDSSGYGKFHHQLFLTVVIIRRWILSQRSLGERPEYTLDSPSVLHTHRLLTHSQAGGWKTIEFQIIEPFNEQSTAHPFNVLINI